MSSSNTRASADASAARMRNGYCATNERSNHIFPKDDVRHGMCLLFDDGKIETKAHYQWRLEAPKKDISAGYTELSLLAGAAFLGIAATVGCLTGAHHIYNSFDDYNKQIFMSKSVIALIILAILILAGTATGVYFLYLASKNKKDSATATYDLELNKWNSRQPLMFEPYIT